MAPKLYWKAFYEYHCCSRRRGFSAAGKFTMNSLRPNNNNGTSQVKRDSYQYLLSEQQVQCQIPPPPPTPGPHRTVSVSGPGSSLCSRCCLHWWLHFCSLLLASAIPSWLSASQHGAPWLLSGDWQTLGPIMFWACVFPLHPSLSICN